MRITLVDAKTTQGVTIEEGGGRMEEGKGEKEDGERRTEEGGGRWRREDGGGRREEGGPFGQTFDFLENNTHLYSILNHQLLTI